MSVKLSDLHVRHYPDPILRMKAEPLPEVTDEIRQVAARMIQIMHEEGGVGLAAPQVGLSWRLFVVNPTGEPGDDRVYVNPELEPLGHEFSDHTEGCLSIPSVSATIRRPKTIRIRALDAEGRSIDEENDGFPARIWQHEFDHLEGVLIIDRMNPMDKLANRRAIRELERTA